MGPWSTVAEHSDSWEHRGLNDMRTNMARSSAYVTRRDLCIQESRGHLGRLDNSRCRQEHLLIWNFMAKIPDETGQDVSV